MGWIICILKMRRTRFKCCRRRWRRVTPILSIIRRDLLHFQRWVTIGMKWLNFRLLFTVTYLSGQLIPLKSKTKIKTGMRIKYLIPPGCSKSRAQCLPSSWLRLFCLISWRKKGFSIRGWRTVSYPPRVKQNLWKEIGVNLRRLRKWVVLPRKVWIRLWTLGNFRDLRSHDFHSRWKSENEKASNWIKSKY